MKRKLLPVLAMLVSSVLFPVFGEEIPPNTAEETEPVRYQFIQQFKWKPVDKAKQYEVSVESFEDGEWKFETSSRTRKTSIQMPLYPGKKRVSITSLNVLGRRGQQTEWAEFVVLSETQPYLYADYLKKSKTWNSPLLRVTKAENEILEDVDVESELGDPENSFFLKGKNIFLTETRFYMVPVDSSEEGKPYEAFNKMRTVSPLKVVRNDFDRPGVVVEYNPDDLYSGYYQIVAENPGNQKTHLDILVLANREPEFNKDQFEYYPNYETNLLKTSQVSAEGNTLTLTGSGFTGDTVFSLNPSTAGIPYPFASAKDRTKNELEVAKVDTLNASGDMKITFSVNPSALAPGYYNLIAENAMGRSEIQVLISDYELEASDVEVKDLASQKADKSSLAFSLKGKGLERENVYTLVSEMSEETGLSERIPFLVADVKGNGKKTVIQGDKEKVKEGLYALLVETSDTTLVKFVEFNKKLKAKLVELSDDEIRARFIRPAGFTPTEAGAEILSQNGPELSYFPCEYKFLKRQKIFIPDFELQGGVSSDYWNFGNNDKIPTVSGNLTLLNFNWLRLNAGGSYNIPYQFASAEAGLELIIPGEVFRPYIGAGAGCNFFFMEDDKPYGIFAYAKLGLVMANFLDISYNLHYSGADRFIGQSWGTEGNPLTADYFYDDISVGIRIPLRGNYFKQKPINETLTVTKSGTANGSEYKMHRKIKKLVFANGVSEVREFSNMEMLTDVSLPDTLKVIGKDAFRGCFNLNTVSIPNGVEEIGDGAFADCPSLFRLVLPPSIKRISPTAFEGWTESQTVVYPWNEDDETVRDLGGNETKLFFRQRAGYTRTPFEERYLFSSYNVVGGTANHVLGTITVDGKRYQTVTLHATASTDENQQGPGISTRASREIGKYLDNGEGITFYAEGTGGTYRIHLRDMNGKGEIYYDFVVQSGIRNKITIPYKKFASYGKKNVSKESLSIEVRNRLADGTKDYTLTLFGFESYRRNKKK